MTARSGFCGFEIAGLADPEPFVLPAAPGAPQLTIVQTRAEPDREMPATGPGSAQISESAAWVWVGPADLAEIDRETLTVRFSSRRHLDDRVIVHPYLAFPMSVATHWVGRLAIHGGAFMHAGRSWALIGDKEGGKSSILGWLLGQGHEIVSDDLLAIEGRTLYSGPRSIDLRGDAAAVLGGEDLGGLSARARWRLRPGSAPPTSTLGGVVHLAWGDEVAIDRLDTGERLRGLVDHSVLRAGSDEAPRYLDLATLPAWRFTRPRDLGRMDKANAQLLDALG